MAPAAIHQPTLLGVAPPGPNPTASRERLALDGTSWVEIVRDWWAGCDVLLAELIEHVPWRQGRRRMWDRMVDDPRLSHWCRRGEPEPHTALALMRNRLVGWYDRPLRPPGLNYYRDGRDSVAWHADRELRDLDDTLVAIVTFGARRPFLIRPAGGGPSTDLAPGSGDLLVMGGAAQRDWEHAVPKTSRPGPRVSVSWRWTSGSARVHGGDHPWLATSSARTSSRAASNR